MGKIIDKLGQLSAVVGFLLCAVAGVLRLAGNYTFSGFEVNTLLQAGVALMVAACVIRLYCPK